jgi:hypothetical protein
MGCFSWVAQNSDRSIIMQGYGTRKFPSRTAYMWDNKGRRWRQPQYEGYGVFGEKDYFVLLAEMNKEYDITVSDNIKREDGIKLEFETNNQYILYPNLTDCKEWTWRNQQPKRCYNQGSSNHYYEEADSSEEDEEDDRASVNKHTKTHKYDDWPNGEVNPLHPVSRL